MKGNRSMQDMTEGRPISLILKFFFPLLFGMLFQQFYNLVDTAIVGKFLGPDDLAAQNTDNNGHDGCKNDRKPNAVCYKAAKTALIFCTKFLGNGDGKAIADTHTESEN